MTELLGNKYFIDPDTGYMLSEKHQRIAEIINDWDSHLSLVFIPQTERTDTDVYPFAVTFTDNAFAAPHVVVYLQEDEVDERLIARLFDMRDNAKDPNAALDNLERASAIVRAKEQEDHQAELHDLAYHMWHTSKHTYTVGDRVFHL